MPVAGYHGWLLAKKSKLFYSADFIVFVSEEEKKGSQPQLYIAI